MVRPSCFAAALLLPVVLSASALAADDCVENWTGGEGAMAKIWGMHRIAVIQAKAGDVLGAKKTLAQIGAGRPTATANVTGVWFCDGEPVYGLPPAPFAPVIPCAATAQVPSDLPSNYLGRDARHGAIVNFTDECDAYGVRVTVREYADGYTVIETPHPAGK